MNKTIICTLTAAMLCLGLQAEAKSFKRGVSENQFVLKEQIDVLTPGVSWYYNWGNTPGQGYEGGVIGHTGIEYVPMCWNGSYNADRIREYCASHPEVKYLLGFNEPNFKAQANLTPSQAAELWPDVVALARELGLEIVAPALNYSPDPPYTNPMTWMQEFVNLVGLENIDYMALHNYGGANVMKDLCTQFHDRFGKDIWVTEFCYWPGGAGNVYVAPSTQISSMIESVLWLEQTPWIHRYAWFKAVGVHQGTNVPNYGLIITENGVGERHLSEQGKVYVYMSDFDENVWHPAGEALAAKECVGLSKAMFGGSADTAEGAAEIEVSQFNAGASIDWQFDVPTAGDYALTLRCSGAGEPTRFDPVLSVCTVAADGSDGSELLAATTLTGLPGADDQYINATLGTLSLPAGHVRLRLKDANPYRPSGIRISTVRLGQGSGVASMASDADGLTNVYSVDGRIVRTAVSTDQATLGLDPGLYIVGGKKVLVTK